MAKCSHERREVGVVNVYQSHVTIKSEENGQMTEQNQTEKNSNRLLAGAILRASRQKNDMSLGDIANQLGYRNLNFISMFERARSDIPISKLMEIITVYRLEAKYALVLLFAMQPDLFYLFLNIIESNKDLVCGHPKKHIEIVIKKLLAEQGRKTEQAI